jgi:Flp pilus assembly CpaE family ATPase
LDRKKVLIISKNDQLKSILAGAGCYSDTSVSAGIDAKIVEGIDILIVDDRAISYSRYLQDCFIYFKKVKSNFYISSEADTYLSIYKSLSSYGVIVIPPQLTIKQAAQRIIDATAGRSIPTSRVCTFFGAGSGCGTAMVSQSVAKHLSIITGKDVGLLMLGGDGGSDYIKAGEGSYGLPSVKSRLNNSLLLPRELKSACIRQENLYILSGESHISKIRYYHPDKIEKLIDLSIEAFDAVLINCGSRVTGMSIGALNSSGLKYLITTQSDKYFNNFKIISEQILTQLGISAADFNLILNKFIDYGELRSEVDLAKDYQMNLSGVIGMVDYPLALSAERDKKTLSELDQYYKKSVEAIAYIIADKLNMKIMEQKKGTGNFKKFITKLFGRGA